MTQKMLQNEKSIPLTKAEQNRDFLFVDDLLHVYDTVLENERKFAAYETFNVGAGQNTNLKYILEYIKKQTNSSSILDFGAVPYRVNELMESNNDISKLLDLGWKPKTSIDFGLDRVIEFEKK
jgi:nucleoside-diphosphate-sugar epimerase